MSTPQRPKRVNRLTRGWLVAGAALSLIALAQGETHDWRAAAIRDLAEAVWIPGFPMGRSCRPIL